jgi:hypothetical protein
MRIAYYGGSWVTNIGNAFIDYGSIFSIKTAFPNAKVNFASELPRWLFKMNQVDNSRSIDLAELMDIDLLIASGMVFCDDFVRNEGPILKKLSDRGVKIVFNGCGCATYDEAERTNFKIFLKSINAIGLISRDNYTYENFKDCFAKAYNGIDCAFLLFDAFDAANLRIKDYIIHNFDYMKEPVTDSERRIVRTHHSCDQFFPNYALQQNKTLFVLRRHKPFIQFGSHGDSGKTELEDKDVLISDNPEDYLNLYANTYATYSDRVHACVATLSFGKFARLYSTSLRARLFERVGAGDILNRLVKLEKDKLREEKDSQISFLREIVN